MLQSCWSSHKRQTAGFLVFPKHAFNLIYLDTVELLKFLLLPQKIQLVLLNVNFKFSKVCLKMWLVLLYQWFILFIFLHKARFIIFNVVTVELCQHEVEAPKLEWGWLIYQYCRLILADYRYIGVGVKCSFLRFLRGKKIIILVVYGKMI